MKRYNDLKREYDALEEKYRRLWGEKSELDYEFAMLKDETEHVRMQDAEIRALHQSVRKLKHDMKNHLMVIGSYMNGKDYEAAKEYTSEILDKLNAVHSYIETGNSLLNHIVNEKFETARRKGILVKAEIENLSFDKMKSMDFSAMFSNMLDNAIEASEKEAGIRPEILVSVFQKRGYEAVCVKNKIGKSVLQKNPKLLSTKTESEVHGMGIWQIRELTEKYQGLCDFYEEDDFFCVCVFIPK
ncbi:MAG: ATP-binding protein [Bacillota bacterium]|nr:ATP-binding protein [Bacillota bacterium]